jgi:hypothetical protein
MGGDYWFTYVYKSSHTSTKAKQRSGYELLNRNASPRRLAAPIGSSSSRHAFGAIR